MSAYQDLGEFIKQYGEMPESVFLARFTEPFLVVNTHSPSGSQPNPLDPESMAVTKRNLKSDSDKGSGLLLTLVVTVGKTGRDDDAEGVSVGRGESNDVVLLAESVSRCHAEFKYDPVSEEAVVKDLGSSYGTTVNGKKIKAHEECPVGNGSTIGFANAASCLFFFPRKFYEYVQRVIEKQRG
ncbi:MAG: FHA domain-containing protein [Planctomycetota bacterium]|jgi:pSer/pThr/pTyr-binding forkhead associated (FHA) protein